MARNNYSAAKRQREIAKAKKKKEKLARKHARAAGEQEDGDQKADPRVPGSDVPGSDVPSSDP